MNIGVLFVRDKQVRKAPFLSFGFTDRLQTSTLLRITLAFDCSDLGLGWSAELVSLSVRRISRRIARRTAIIQWHLGLEHGRHCNGYNRRVSVMYVALCTNARVRATIVTCGMRTFVVYDRTFSLRDDDGSLCVSYFFVRPNCYILCLMSVIVQWFIERTI